GGSTAHQPAAAGGSARARSASDTTHATAWPGGGADRVRDRARAYPARRRAGTWEAWWAWEIVTQCPGLPRAEYWICLLYLTVPRGCQPAVLRNARDRPQLRSSNDISRS